jgi:hypothetical protein
MIDVYDDLVDDVRCYVRYSFMQHRPKKAGQSMTLPWQLDNPNQ